MYWGSADNRYFWIFSWDDIISGGGGGGIIGCCCCCGTTCCCNKSSSLGWWWSFWSLWSLLEEILPPTLWRTVPVEEVVEEAVDVEELAGKWLSRAQSSPSMASEKLNIFFDWYIMIF